MRPEAGVRHPRHYVRTWLTDETSACRDAPDVICVVFRAGNKWLLREMGFRFAAISVVSRFSMPRDCGPCCWRTAAIPVSSRKLKPRRSTCSGHHRYHRLLGRRHRSAAQSAWSPAPTEDRHSTPRLMRSVRALCGPPTNGAVQTILRASPSSDLRRSRLKASNRRVRHHSCAV